MKQIFQVPGYLTGIQSKVNSWKLSFEIDDSQINSESISKFTDLKGKQSWITVNSHIIEAEDIIDLPPIRPVEEGEKTPSQRLRSVLAVMWKQSPEGFKTCDEHYKYYIEKFINHIKDKLND